MENVNLTTPFFLEEITYKSFYIDTIDFKAGIGLVIGNNRGSVPLDINGLIWAGDIVVHLKSINVHVSSKLSGNGVGKSEIIVLG